MRVTDRMIFDRAAASAGTARDRMQEASEQVSSGARLTHPGDDPVAASLLVSYRQDQARQEAIATGVSRANNELTSADSALEMFGNLLSRGRELAMQFANSTYSADQRATGSEEVKTILEDAIAALNTKVDGRYVFGGDHDATPPFDSKGAYLGDTRVRQVEIAPGIYQDASVRADVIAKGIGGGADALTTLGNLAAALASNDVPAIQAALDPLDGAIRQVGTGRASAGAAMAVLDSATLAAHAAKDAAKEAASHEADADAIDSASKLALAQRALDAALTASAQNFKLTLLDKL